MSIDIDELRTPDEWCAEYGVRVMDPDGWRGRHLKPWDEPLTLRDFVARVWISTIASDDPKNWDRMVLASHGVTE